MCIYLNGISSSEVSKFVDEFGFYSSTEKLDTTCSLIIKIGTLSVKKKRQPKRRIINLEVSHPLLVAFFFYGGSTT